MKKWFSVLLSIGLSASVLFTSIGSVNAKAIAVTPLPNPTVTPITGNTKFNISFMPILDLPGTSTTSTEGMIYPVGFPTGEKQFEGEGVLVSGFTYGTAKACFPITAINQGWGGQIGSWNGKKWDLLPTTITTPNESSYSWACATIASNGTYALITWVVDASMLPGLSKCTFTVTPYLWPSEEFGLVLSAQVPAPNTPKLLTPVYYKLLTSNPPASITGPKEGVVYHGKYGKTYTDFINLKVDLATFVSATLYVKYPTCWTILYYDQSTGTD